jgi:hypothetical protein
VEALVKSVIVFLSGLAITATGAFIRSCSDGLPPEFAQSWCGSAPPSALLEATHSHCAGCILVVSGLALLAIAPLFELFASKKATARAGER